jgi:signal transduction protein with GAF and PtsI domain
MANDLGTRVHAALGGASVDRFDRALASVVGGMGAHVGTLHRLDADRHLHLVAASPGIPEPVLAASRRIPLGKGIAGEAAATGKPVTLCNLQTDTSGVARPGAKATGLGGSLCVPVRDGETIVGTLGVGWMGEREITDADTDALLEAASVLAPALMR